MNWSNLMKSLVPCLLQCSCSLKRFWKDLVFMTQLQCHFICFSKIYSRLQNTLQWIVPLKAHMEMTYRLCGLLFVWDGNTHFSVSWNTHFSTFSFWVVLPTEKPKCSAPCWWMAAVSLPHVSDGQSVSLCWQWAGGDAESARSF